MRRQHPAQSAAQQLAALLISSCAFLGADEMQFCSHVVFRLHW
jgi:hypothetical protein